MDTDLRRPSLHKLLDLPALPGLTDVLLGHAALEPREVMPGLSVLAAGSTPPNPGELLNSRTFRNLVETLTAQADIVIFDSAPVLVAADCRHPRLADGRHHHGGRDRRDQEGRPPGAPWTC